MSRQQKMEKKILISKLHALGWSFRKIQQETGVHRETIAKYVKESLLEQEKPEKIGQAKDSEKSSSNSLCVPFDDFIKECILKNLSAQRIYQDLVRDHSFQGSYTSVQRYVRSRSSESKDSYFRIHTLPGEEAQVDFGQGAPTFIDGKISKPWLFTMVLGYSRMLYAEVVWHQDVETFLRCHERGFLSFVGVPLIIRLDNLKSGVLKAHLFEPELNPVYVDFSNHYGFSPLPCLPATPEHKGKVEAGVKYVQNNALKGKEFASLDAQNTYLRQWTYEIAQQRIHGTTKKRPIEMFENEERQALKPCPNTCYEYFRTGLRSVHMDGHVEVERAYYSVPHNLVGKTVVVHYNSLWVKAISDGIVVSAHKRVQPGSFQTSRSHLPLDKSCSFEECLKNSFVKIKDIGPHCQKWATEVMTARQKLGLRAILGVLTLEKKFSHQVINAACEQALQIGSVRFHTIKILCEDECSKKQEKSSGGNESEIIRSLDEYQNFIDSIEM
jgi:transposase